MSLFLSPQGIVWGESLARAPKTKAKRRSVDALKACNNDPHVVVQVARVFWRDRRKEKARKWFTRSVAINPDFGDAWVCNRCMM
jgi:pre-mRNA-processing factor 6